MAKSDFIGLAKLLDFEEQDADSTGMASSSEVSIPMLEIESGQDKIDSRKAASGRGSRSDKSAPRKSVDKKIRGKDKNRILDLFQEDLDDLVKTGEHGDSYTGETLHSTMSSNSSFPRDLKQPEIEMLKSFSMTPIASGLTLRCELTWDRKGVTRSLNPQIYLEMELEYNRKVLILAARKRKKCARGTYIISVDPSDVRRSAQGYIGKVCSNVLGTQFTIYNAGISPSSKQDCPCCEKYVPLECSNIREELGKITQEKSFVRPRKMRIAIPKSWKDGQHPQLQLEDKVEQDKLDGFTELLSKKALWNDKDQSHVLDFKDLGTQASSKNFQIISRNDEKHIILQLRRTEEDKFTMFIRSPFCPLQAFAIALTNF